MSNKKYAGIWVLVAAATISLAVPRLAAPKDGGRPAARGAELQPDGPGGPPPGFGPGMFIAPQVLDFADANADGSLSPDEAARGAEKFVREADVEKKGSIDADTLGQAVNRRMGPPGGGPGGQPDGPGGPRRGPGGFGPGTFLAPGSWQQPTPTRMAGCRPPRLRKRPSSSCAIMTPRRRVRSMKTLWPKRSTGEWDHRPASAPAAPGGRWVRAQAGQAVRQGRRRPPQSA